MFDTVYIFFVFENKDYEKILWNCVPKKWVETIFGYIPKKYIKNYESKNIFLNSILNIFLNFNIKI